MPYIIVAVAVFMYWFIVFGVGFWLASR